jgi:hypothetical protein
MSISKAVYTGIGTALLASSFSLSAVAGPSDALAACKDGIAEDARLSHYSKVAQKTGDIKRRGRYTSFEIKVNAKTAEGANASWVANCKARNNGKLENLELVQVSGETQDQVAQSGS